MDKDDTKRVSKAIITHKGKLLLLLPKNKQKWHLPGGHIKKDETYIEGAKREVHEETALKVTALTSIYRHHNFELFFCKTSSNNVILSSEHREFKWVDAETAIKKMTITTETKRDIIQAIGYKYLKMSTKPAAPIKKKAQDDVENEGN